MPHSYSSSVGWKRVEDRPITSRETKVIEGTEMKLVNVEEQVWPGITRGDIINYYISIYPYLKPYLQGRAVGLNISFNAVEEDEEFIRGMEGHQPEWATIFQTVRKNVKPGQSAMIDWLVLNDLPSVIFNINLGAIDLHPWTSRTAFSEQPDYIVVDLDPTDGDFKKAVETSKAVKEFVDKHQLHSFVKTSGKTGLHIFLPCQGIEYAAARKIGDQISNAIHQMLPDITTLKTRVNEREDKVYVDPSQNDYADRMASIYSVRSYKHPSVSTPVEWSEVNESLNPLDFTIETIFERINQKGDLWADILEDEVREHNYSRLKNLT